MKTHYRNLKISFLLSSFYMLIGCGISQNTTLSQINNRNVEYALKGSGSPTIVFETGMGPTIDTWSKVLDTLSKHTKVYAYNRPGYGKSNISNPPENVVEVAKQLRQNLIAQQVSPPYLLVGHSAGGLYINMFARLFPNDVIGVVFIDASHPEQFEYFKNHHSMLHDLLITSTRKGNRKYEYDIVVTTLKSFEDAPIFPNIPVTVLTAGKKSSPLETKKLRDKWLYFQNELKNLSNDGKQIIVKNSGHYIHKNEPEIVINEILRMLGIESLIYVD